MKKFFALACMLFVSSAMFAQMSIRAGIGLSTMTGKDADGINNGFSYKVGMDYDYKVSEQFSVIPGIEFANKGYKADDLDGQVNLFYLQVPIFAAYKMAINETMGLQLKAGPYLAYGLFGSDIEYKTSSGQTVSKYNIWDSKTDNQRFAAGLILGVNLDLGEYLVGIEFSRALTKFNKDAKQYGQAFGVTFGHRF
jgi:hypothetical protein